MPQEPPDASVVARTGFPYADRMAAASEPSMMGDEKEVAMIWFAGAVAAAWLVTALAESRLALHAALSAPVPVRAAQTHQRPQTSPPRRHHR